jgi:hypothetical protein
MRRNTYIKDINGHNLYEDDIVFYIVKRCSSSCGNYGKIATLKDGYFRIHGKICFKYNNFVIVGDENEIKILKMPVGKEAFSREVWFNEISLSDYSNIDCGKSFVRGYIEKINRGKKKKIINKRLEALGIA